MHGETNERWSMTGYHEFIFHREPRRGLLLDFFLIIWDQYCMGNGTAAIVGSKRAKFQEYKARGTCFKQKGCPNSFVQGYYAMLLNR